MNTNPTYEPIKCMNKECAFPGLTCNECNSNKTIKRKSALVVKDAKARYSWIRAFMNHKKI